MRVEVKAELAPGDATLEIPWEQAGERYLDLRSDARAIAAIEPARRYVPLGRFLDTVNGLDSVFRTAKCSAHAGQGAAAPPESHEFASSVHLLFADEKYNFRVEHYEGLAGQLGELLARDSPADALHAGLRIRSCRFRTAGRDGFCLAILLSAQGATPEQAELRWGLGLTRIQQALLFLSRVVRHHQAAGPAGALVPE